MSHVVEIKHRIKDIECLALAAKDCGLELRTGQQTYRWFGQHMGDYPLPEGFTPQDLGKCAHALRVPPSDEKFGRHGAYEVGVCHAKDGKGGYALLFDFWNGGYGLMEKIGPDAGKLLQRYEVQVAKKVARQQGYALREESRPDGSVQIHCTKKAGF